MCAVIPWAELLLEREAREAVVPARRCEGRDLVVDSSSDGIDEDVWEVGGDGSSIPPENTRAKGARVRNVGPCSGFGSGLGSLLPSCRLGNVKAQLSHGPARLVT